MLGKLFEKHQENSFDSWGCWANGNGLNWYLPPTTQLPVMQNHWWRCYPSGFNLKEFIMVPSNSTSLGAFPRGPWRTLGYSSPISSEPGGQKCWITRCQCPQEWISQHQGLLLSHNFKYPFLYLLFIHVCSLTDACSFILQSDLSHCA